MRALLIGALGLSLIGCSHSLPPQPAVVACVGASASCSAGQPPQPMWLKAPSRDAMQATPVRMATTEEPSPIHTRARVRLADRLAAKGESDTSAKLQASETPSAHVPLPRSAPRIAGNVAAAQASVEDQNAIPLPPENPDFLVAVLMARLDTKSVSDLAGKTIAIDERYAKSASTVRTAIVAAGAPEVQLSEGQTTAINRLTNGEVPAAVVALLSPEGAETFSEIKGFKIFNVPLSPRAARVKQ